ncbi:MAG: helix-hairpin-helix domain-containing protein [Fimbriimonadaceae bacterium]|nr:helix-hairpin-helix domain-containing protein [Fimbriimonadaceae bacterium]
MDAAIKELMTIPNIGKAMAGDLILLGIHSIAELKTRDADELYASLCAATNCRQDPCVWDTFAAAVHFAKTGEAKKWWEYTAERKRRGLPAPY